MSSTVPEPEQNPRRETEGQHMAHELRKEAERLQALADQLAKQEDELQDMRANYPVLREFYFNKLREFLDKTLEPLPENVDLEAYALEHDGQPLEAFIDEIDRLAEQQ
ncbi:MAG TPA: hypothetical protein VE988_03455 [Gemmataceae bacterium]|nr:hypothetical protein [Gemmataceae bacterium]